MSALCKNCPYSELFWSAFSRIWTEYSVSLCIKSECGKMRTRITLNTETFYGGYKIEKLHTDVAYCRIIATTKKWSHVTFVTCVTVSLAKVKMSDSSTIVYICLYASNDSSTFVYIRLVTCLHSSIHSSSDSSTLV